MKTLFLTLMCACVPLLGAQTPVRTSESARLHALFDAEWDHTMETSPTWASQSGDRRFNDRWPDLSVAAIEREHQHAKEVLQKLVSIDRAKLPEVDQTNLDLFRWQLEDDIEEFRFGGHFIPLNQR